VKHLVCHPNNAAILVATARRAAPKVPEASFASSTGFALPGVVLVESAWAPEFATHWVFPHDQFVEYEPSDEDWCRYFGIGHEEENRDERVFYMMDGPPDLWPPGPSMESRVRNMLSPKRDPAFSSWLEAVRRSI
jgi:hypothetical protein